MRFKGKFLKNSKKSKIVLKRQKTGKDFSLIFLTILLSLFGLLMIFNVSSISALRDFSDKYYYLKEQGVWFVLGLSAMLFFSFFDYHKFYKLSFFLLILTLFFLGLVFVPGIGIKALGASRWINLSIISFQPAEFAKLSLVIYLASWFSYKEKERFLSFIILLSLVVGLIILEPDLGTAGIISIIAFILYFLSEAPLWHFFVLAPLGAFALFLFSITSSYRLKRIMTFLNSKIDPQGASYQLRQILIALGSGGFFGIGLGKSRQKFAYLPESTTDSIFAIIGEELGFLGASFIILLFFLIFIKGIKIAFNAPDKFGRLLGFGLISSLAIQIIVNLASIVALVPLTGVPLPFISYGGSNLIISFSFIGILVNISRQS